MKKLVLFLVITLLLPVSAFAWDKCYQPDTNGKINFNKVTSIELLGWKTDLEGNVRANGTAIDLGSEVSIGSENSAGFRISHVLNHKASLELSYIKNDHSGYTTKTFTFENKTYKPNAHMSLQNSWFDLAYAHNLTRSKQADKEGREVFYLDGLFGVKFSNAEIKVTGNDTTVGAAYIEENWDETFPVPYIGLAAGGQLADNLWLKGYLKYIKVNAGGADALHNDYGINLALRLNPNHKDTEWFVELGYRGVKYDIEKDNDRANLRYSGPTFGAFARF
ncbi:MAG: hypothetical protein KKB51_13615 [Candidatus Riflebacteria bacterium]|nr:hypothetical protein [Candidatus Riflebacteria bacterium]